MTYLKITKLVLLGVVTLTLGMVLVNSMAPAPTLEKVDDRVTRYYHYNSNPNDQSKPLARLALFLLNIYESIFGGRGFIVYQLLNILIYAVIWPFLMLYLTYWALRPLERREA